jgi:beta-lactamase superfamily II metal-dependent hydrolase
VAVHRARRSNLFSARGRLWCAENLILLAAALSAAAVWAAGVAFSAGGAAARPALRLPAGQLAVVVLDVRQGDAVFIQTPDLKRVLVDAGPAPTDRDSFSAGRDKIVPFLREQRVERLDAVVLSHAHADHIGGLAYVLQSVPVDRVYDPGFDFASEIYLEALGMIEKSDGRIGYQVVRQGDTLPIGGETVWQVLSPPRPYLSGTRSDCNSNSVVLRLAWRGVSFLFLGDAEEETEEALAEYGPRLRSTFLKVAHHGSRYSSSPFFLDLVRPLHALISCGTNNAFGHPHEETLQRLGAAGAAIHRTDLGGDLLVLSDGSSYKVVEQRRGSTR